MKALNKLGWRAAVGVTAIASATVIALAAPAGAHVASGPPDVDCNTASVDLKDFPSGPSEITFHITVNGKESEKTAQLPGKSGTVSVTISDLTTATGPLDIEAFASWEVDGGGKSDTTKLNDEVCHETTTTTEGPPVEVGGIQAERDVPTSVSAAAAAVTAEPTFTG